MRIRDHVSGLTLQLNRARKTMRLKSRQMFRGLLVEALEGRRLLATIDLNSLGLGQGTTIFGVDASDASGFSVSNAGDFNGDGYDDVLIGALNGDAASNAKSNAGESYVVFGGPSLAATIDLNTLGSAGVTIFGSDTQDYSGSSVSSAGDVNGDGFDDLVVGASFADASGNAKSYAGEAYVIFGSATPTATINLASIGASGTTIFGAEAFDQAGFSVSNAGDVNGDGISDLLIGANQAGGVSNTRTSAGDSYVVFGSNPMPATINLASLGSAGITISGAESFDQSGYSVSAAGDVNGDGFSDLIIGAIGSDGAANAKSLAGESYILFGGPALPSTIDLATIGTASGAAGITILGVDSNDESGISVSGAGDVNGDGFDDLLVGARYGDASGNIKSNTGESYLIFGAATLAVTIDLNTLGSVGVTFFGGDIGDQSGFSVSDAGDVNGDGYDDLIVGAIEADSVSNGRVAAGESYVIFGAASLSTTIDFSTVLGAAGITIFGAAVGDKSGSSVSGAGDVNGDGFDDLIIGAFDADASGNAKIGAGDSYIIFGGNSFTSSVTHLGTTAAETLTGTAGSDVIVGGRDNDILIGSGGVDVLIGGQGNDILAISDTTFRRVVGGTGIDTLRFDGSGLSLDLETLADNRIFGIETIDITGSGNNTLVLGRRDVLNISNESNLLTVIGNAGDRLSTIGWTFVSNALGFNTYIRGNATLKVTDTVIVQLTLNLANLTAARGSTVFGAEQGVGAFPGDRSGYSVSNAGDVNGDGFEDLIVGAYQADASSNAKDAAGDSYLIFGSASFPASIDLASLGSAGVVIYGAMAGDFAGWSVSTAGDMNGDGFDDVIIGAKYANGFIGQSYVLFGQATFASPSLDLAIPSGVTVSKINGIAISNFSGYSVSSAGDMDGDGYDELVVGAPGANAFAGQVYLIYGSAMRSSTINVNSLGSGGTMISGAAANDRAGGSISNAGDVNGDGLDDLIIGAYQANTNTGKSYIVYGSTTRVSTINLGTLGAAGVTINGIASLDNSGSSVSGAGDINGDGFDDVIVGATLGDAAGNLKSDAGETYIVFGGASLPATINLASLGSAGVTVFGATASDFSGDSVSIAGDVNGDGYDDLIIGAVNANSTTGASYLVFGGASLPTTIDLATLGTPSNALGMTIFGIYALDQNAVSVSNAGDVNGDGFDDLLVGANYASSVANGRTKAGETYLIYGRDFTEAITHQGTAAAEAVVGSTAANLIVGGRGTDTIVGNGGADVLTGGQGDDVLAVSDLTFRRIVGGTGNDTLRLDGSGQTLNLTTLADNRILGIETIDISGSGINTLTVGLREVLNISDSSNRLVVQRDSTDAVNVGSGWTVGANQSIGSRTFTVYTQGAASLWVQVYAAPSVTITSGNVTYNSLAYAATASIASSVSPTPTLTFEYYTDAAATTVIAAPENAGTYFVRASTAANLGNIAAQSSIATFTISKIALVAGAGTASSKIYDGTTAAVVTRALPGVLPGDNVVGTTVGTFSNKNIGVAKTVTFSTAVVLSGNDSGNYTVGTGAAGSVTADINPKGLNVVVVGANKVYDATVAATVTPLFTGVIGVEVVTASTSLAPTFASKTVANTKPITFGTVVLGGADAGNYVANLVGTTTAIITKANLTAMATAANKVYNAATAATVTIVLGGVLLSDVVSGTASGTFSDKNIGVGKTVTIGTVTLGGGDAGNYTVGSAGTALANITTKAITGSITAANKVFDGNTSATILTRTLTGVEIGDTVSYVGGTAAFDTSAVGNSKTVTGTGLGLSLGGDSGNYTVNTTAVTTANITAPPASIQEAYLFYKGSTFQTNLGVAGAIDPINDGLGNLDGKDLLLSGASAQATVVANVSNYSRGINGLVFDVNNLTAATLTASDFVFRRPAGLVSGVVDPSTWTGVVPAPTAINVSVLSGSTSRVRIEFPDWNSTTNTGGIANTWLQVILKANSNTGLTAPAVYYIGHAAGEGAGGSPYRVGVQELSNIQSGISSAFVPLSDVRDVDKSRRVGVGDLSFVQPRVSSTILLQNITIPIAGSASEGAPPPGPEFGSLFLTNAGGGESSPYAAPSVAIGPSVPTLSTVSFKLTPVNGTALQASVPTKSSTSTDVAVANLYASSLASVAATNSSAQSIDDFFSSFSKKKVRV